MTDRSLRALGGLDYVPAPEASDDIQDWLKRRGHMFPHFINGQFQRFYDGEMLPVFNPATGEKLAWISQGRSEDVEAAMFAAHDAALVWGSHPGQRRAEYLYAIARAIARHSRMFARLESLNNGKTIRETRDLDTPLVIRHFYNCAGWAANLDEEFPSHRPGGVVAQIIPWNFPLLMLAWKIAPALAAGNTVVLKPAESTPLTAMLFAEILRDEVKLPPGVVNIVNGAAETGKLIVKHPRPWKVAFTGSTEVGRWIRRETAGSGKRLTLELGGKSPFIIFDDADIDSAIEGVVDAIWFNYGQVCCAGSRLLIQESIYEKVIAKLKARMSKLRGGAPLDKTMDLGAVNSRAQLEKIERLVEKGKSEGNEIWQPEGWTCPADGFHFKPTLVTNVQTSGTLAREEIFGPVLVCMSFRTPKEAIELANNTTYGLAASVWTEKGSKALGVARQIKAGTIWNNCTNLFDAASGFGGNRESGYGREGGREGMEEYLVEQYPVRFGVTAEAELLPALVGIDRTYRLFIGGELVRPDEGQSFPVHNASGEFLGSVANANRKDVRNAVAAARKIQADWEFKMDGHKRSQLLYFMAENLSAHRDKFVGHARSFADAQREFDQSIENLFRWAGYADKFGGEVQEVQGQINCQAIREPVGVIGIRAPDNSPLLGLVTLIGAAVGRGNSVVVIAGDRPMQAMELIQVIENSDFKKWPGVINILTSKNPDARAKELAEHLDVDAIWCWSSPEVCAEVERASSGNMKRVWTVSDPESFDWYGQQGRSKRFLREATQVKNIWTPYGV